MKLLQEFKKFAVKGNAIDLAVGVIIGAAFGKIVTSLVEDIINPVIGLMTGGINFSDKVFKIGIPLNDTPQLVIKYGMFITNIINFLIIAFSIFIIIKQLNRFKEKEEKKPELVKISEEVKLLGEIRDLLSNK
jgi:large conductance mechanosensitive channel